MTATVPIKIIHKPSLEQLQDLRVHAWDIWTKEVSTFPWFYDQAETCYLLEGKVIVTPENGTGRFSDVCRRAELHLGDLATSQKTLPI